MSITSSMRCDDQCLDRKNLGKNLETLKLGNEKDNHNLEEESTETFSEDLFHIIISDLTIEEQLQEENGHTEK